MVQRDEELLPRIRVLKAEHAFWGYHRIWAYLHVVEHQAINKKRVLRLMREHHLLVPPTEAEGQADADWAQTTTYQAP